MTRRESGIAVRVQRVRRDRTGVKLVVFAVLAVAVVLVAVFAPTLCPYDPYAQNLSQALQPPSSEHWAGTDRYGRDLFSRIIMGSQSSIFSTLALVAIIAAVGTVIGVLCGMVPIANIIALVKIIGVTNREVREETEKIKLNESRKNDKICATKYPVLLVHGVFFRDFKYLNYWGRIPSELEKNGAKIYYGNHQSALSVEDSGRELAARIREIVSETGCEKVNIIAHSKGGLDCRCALTHFGAAPYVATLTTINTPHRGCLFADYLLGKVPEQLKNTIAGSYNLALKRLGDSDPDFIAAVTDLTNENCKLFNERTPDSESVYYQSVGSKLNHATDGKFPLNFSYHIVKHFDGENDGLVSETSFPWGNCYKYLKTDGRRGISHGDMIDLNRENIKDFDVREFYVQLVSDLKNNGY